MTPRTRNDRNIIRIAKRGVWHYWNFGSMWPLCDPTQTVFPRDPTRPDLPLFVTSQHATFRSKQYHNVCKRCTSIANEIDRKDVGNT